MWMNQKVVSQLAKCSQIYPGVQYPSYDIIDTGAFIFYIQKTQIEY